ncbi:tetratricopeptide repeat protein [Brachyspira murdochii]|uniref:TPR repeat-containing protein n=1 Tax=Brachyspira murdochii (strain ATCC 51284 / DSM 12563 / 56-150) TaxID=526224 RepID=D5UAY7_BRAM5|nr:tetratricopeptide repeat protein [Brachyspira murdochii]ADG71860.1 TPR repeat-containing protein [Brachyspira murdochii DSM 12563]
MRVFLCSSMLLMFTIFQAVFAQETITVKPDDKVVTNETVSARVKGGPLEKDLVKTVDLSENTLFSIKLNATNFDRYIRITSYSTNLDFVRFTRDKTNAFLTFRTLTAGIGKLDFQVDNEENIIRKYFYTINVTNSQGIAAMETNAILEPDNETMTNDTISTNTVSTNTAMTNEVSANTMSTNTAMTNDTISTNTVSTNTTMTNEANTTNQNNTASTNQQSSVIKKPSVIRENTQAKAPVESNPETIALFKSAEDLKNIKDYNNAVSTYSNVISQYPKSKYSVYSYFRIGDIYNQNKDYNNAFDMYKQASSLENANNNEKAAALYSMGVVKKSENKHDEAIAYFNDVMNKYSSTSMYGNAAYEIADSLKTLGRISDAAPILEKSLEGNNKFSKRGDAILLLAEVYEKGDNNTRDFDKAYQTYNQYLAEYPTSSKAKYANDRKNFLYRNAVNLR